MKKKQKPFTPLPPSAHGQTVAQRLAKLRLFAEITRGKRGRMAEQRERYLIEIEVLTRDDPQIQR